MVKERKSSPRRPKTKAKRRPAKDGTMRGRIPELLKDPGLVDRICNMVRMGTSFRDSCGAVGISEDTFYSWQAKAKEEGADPLYVEFLDKLQRARTEGKAALIGIIHKAGRGEPIFHEGKIIGYKDGDWKASSHLLAIIDPEQYSVRYKIEHSGPQGGAIQGVIIYLPQEDEE